MTCRLLLDIFLLGSVVTFWVFIILVTLVFVGIFDDYFK